MIRDKLIPIIQQRYSGEEVRISPASNPIAVFPGKDNGVGELQIWDDGDEATIYIGEFTHGHFNLYNPELNQDEIDKQVAEDVLGFLEDMFADKIVIWKSREGGSGGWQYVDFTEGPIGRRDVEYYVWSGPYRG